MLGSTTSHTVAQARRAARVTISLENQAEGADELSVCNAASLKGAASQPLHPLSKQATMLLFLAAVPADTTHTD
jgi:hypothetical protein